MFSKIIGTTLVLYMITFQGHAYLLDHMTLEEKVGQLLMVHFNGESANEDAKTLIQKAHIGSIIYYNWANGLQSPLQVHELSHSLQKLANENQNRIPLLIAVDQEGGLVARLTKGFTEFPGNKALGMTQDPKLAELCAFTLGKELQNVGVNLNLSPVVDINSNQKNPTIGLRAFSDSPNVVVDFAKSALKGFRSAGIISVLKHFPGHGDAEIDSHEDLPKIMKSKEELRLTEFVPFFQLSDQADAIMTAHLIVPALDPINCTTLSKASLDILRNELGFNGVIISDSLIMEGLLKNCLSIDDATIRALNAGCDMIMLGGKQLIGKHKNQEITVEDILRIHQTLVEAVQTGIISEHRLNDAVQRILDLKKRFLMDQSNPSVDSFTNFNENHFLANEIATRSLHIQKNISFPLIDLSNSRIALLAPKIVKHAIIQTSLYYLNQPEALFFEELNPDDNENKAATALAKDADVIIFCVYNAWKNDKQVMLVNALLNTNKPLFLIVLRDPIDATLFPLANLIITTFSPTSPSIQAAFEKILNLNLGYAS